MAAGSSFGNLFRVTTWGESHGKGIGVVVDGCPAGLEISEEVIQKYLNRRKPGRRVIRLRERRTILSRYSQVFLRVRRRGHLSLWLFTIRHSVQRLFGDC